ncbi:uncharacterized protein LOC131149051 [Malania oleifera]|uniref:uncharacterized protein LOC131149051 n=1 Tax=Malania oleifera TaxID=397392 RepID=UPI0025ADBE3C|nr:uncharacterized protein LOC131149051 [Malania oleifera]
MEGFANGRVDDTQGAIPEEVSSLEVGWADGETKHDDVPFDTSVEVENSEHMKQTHVADDSNSSNISPNVGSQIIEKSSHALDLEKLEEVSDSDLNNNTAPADSFEPHMLGEWSQVVEASVENSGSSDVAELVVKEVDEKVFRPSSDENSGLSPVVTEKVTEVVNLAEDRLLSPKSNGNSHVVSDVTELEPKEVEESVLPSPNGNSGFSPVAADLVSKEVGDKVLPSPDENNEFSPGASELISKELNPIEKSTLPASDEKSTVESSDLVAPAPTETVDNSLQQADIPGVQNSNDGGEQSSESQIPESTEYQPIITVTPSTIQPSSWRSCCGLFDVLRRSN